MGFFFCPHSLFDIETLNGNPVPRLRSTWARLMDGSMGTAPPDGHEEDMAWS